jgi:hypothetical protein
MRQNFMWTAYTYKSGGQGLASLWPRHSTKFWAQSIVRNALKWDGALFTIIM